MKEKDVLQWFIHLQNEMSINIIITVINATDDMFSGIPWEYC